MATGGGETNYSCCSGCLDDGRNTIARHYCVDCEIYFCTKCLKHHNKIPATRKHQVNEVNSSVLIDNDDDTCSSTPSLQSDIPSEPVHRLRCTLHQGQVIDTFCKDHDEVCCKLCAKVTHRLCTTVLTNVAAKDFKVSPERNKYKDALTENIKFNEEKEKRQANLECIGKQNLEHIETVDKYEETAIAKINEMANNSRKEIRSLYEEHKTTLDMDIEALDVGIATNTEYTKNLEQSDEEQQFIYVKTNKSITKDGEMLLQAMATEYKELGIRFHFDDTLVDHIRNSKSFCTPEEYKATFVRTVTIKQSGDDPRTFLYDACMMDTGELLVTDDQNKKLKRFDNNLQFKDEIKLSGKPVAVCKISKHEVAVRIKDTKVVQIVSVGQSMQLTISFELADDGYGMTYDAGTGELFACEENKVSVYCKTGNLLRAYDKDTNGEQIFLSCRQIALSVDKQDIYVTNWKNGLIILDRSGTFKMKVALTGVNHAWPLCLLPGKICLAGCWTSGVIVQVNKNGKQVGNLIDTKDERNLKFCAVYDHHHSRLIVGGYPSVISVYTLSAK